MEYAILSITRYTPLEDFAVALRLTKIEKVRLARARPWLQELRNARAHDACTNARA